MRRVLVWLLILPVLMAAMGWLTLPWSAQYLIERWLVEQGFDSPSFTMRHPSWQRLQIDHLSVSQAGDGRRVRLSADNVQLLFAPLALLQGQLTELRVEQARIEIEADHSLKGRAAQLQQQSDPLDLTRFHPQQLFSYAPSKRLVIAQLELSYRAPDQPPFYVRGNLDLEPHLLQSRLLLQLDQQPLGYLDLGFDTEYRLHLQLTQADTTPLKSQLQLFPDGSQWRLEAITHLQIKPILSGLEQLHLTLPSDISGLSGQLELTSQLQMPGQLITNTHSLLQQLQSEHHIKANLSLPARQTRPGADLNLLATLGLQQGNLRLQLQPSTRLALHVTERTLPELTLSADLQLLSQQLQIKGPLRIQTTEPPLTLDTELELDTTLNGRLHLNLQPAQVAALLPALKPWFTGTDQWPEVQGGTLHAKGILNLNPKRWQLELRPTLNQAHLKLGDTQIKDLNLDSHITLQKDLSFTARGAFSIDHTDAGVRLYGPDLSYVLTGYSNGQYWLQLTPFSLSTLDGIIAVPALGFDPLNPQLETRLAVSAFDLGRILELYPQEGLYGSGVLGGELPIKVAGSDISINNGHLLSGAEGGVIRYQPTPEIALMGQHNPGVQLALGALTDLRFELLDLKLDYHADGTTDLRARLKGQNPDWQQGRPVDLNLNIEENLLDLLKTLQLTGRLTDSIDRRFNR